MVVEPDVRRIEVARWAVGGELTWEVLGPGGTLVTSLGRWDLDGIYDLIDATAST